MNPCQKQISLRSVFGNEFKICVPQKGGPFANQEDLVTLMFDEKGIVLERSELEKLKQFLLKL